VGLDLELSASLTLGDLEKALDDYGHKHHKAEPNVLHVPHASGIGRAV